MTESNQMLLDVKLDLKDGKCELYYLKSWVKCFVKIEAIQCFPCYLKISFFYHDADTIKDVPFAIIRINIPGVRVEAAASRTKAMVYGAFWKNNRKRCKLFFAFNDKTKYTEHMHWLQQAIDSLEDYRKKILENHRMSRSITANQTDDEKITGHGALKTTTKSIDAHTKTVFDVLGPLPAIPSTSFDDTSRWSMRRASNCSEIYEEILDPSVRGSENDASRKSVTSGIYVDMKTPIHHLSAEHSEVPPPLPPRRRFTQHACSEIAALAAKSKKSTWNLMSMFGRSKTLTGLTPQPNPTDKNIQNGPIMAKSRSENFSIDLLASKHNSFSTPDLTNITPQPKDDGDDADLDIMDIERSNSLNSTANQFLSRPLPLPPSARNISTNILWTHNLSTAMTSRIDSSAINLVGANVNSLEQRDLSDYCPMAPIIRKTSSSIEPLSIQSTCIKEEIKEEEQSVDTTTPNHLIDNKSGYCHMVRPATVEEPKATIDRSNDLENDSLLLLEFSLLSNDKHSSHRSSIEGTSSSGIGSDASNQTIEDCTQTDCISIACTESPTSPSSPSPRLNQTTPFYATKFDEKYPSYFPNDSFTYSPSLTSSSCSSKRNRNEWTPTKSQSRNVTQFTDASSPSQNSYKRLISTPVKVQKTKQRKNSDHSLVMTASNDENWCSYHRKERNHKSSDHCKFNASANRSRSEAKNILTDADGNAKLYGFDRKPTTTSSPRRIYNKCATLAVRLRTPPSPTAAPTPTTPNETIEFHCSSHTTIPSMGKSFSFDVVDTVYAAESNSNNRDGIGLLRFASLSRFRKIDFSPLKVKINNILHRPNIEL